MRFIEQELWEEKHQVVEMDQMIIFFSIFKISSFHYEGDLSEIVSEFKNQQEKSGYARLYTSQKRNDMEHYSKFDKDGYEYRLTIAQEVIKDSFASEDFHMKEEKFYSFQSSVISSARMEIDSISQEDQWDLLYKKGFHEACLCYEELVQQMNGIRNHKSTFQIIEDKIFREVPIFPILQPQTRVEVDTIEVFGLKYVVPTFFGILLKPNEKSIEDLVHNHQSFMHDITNKLLGDPYLFSERLSGGIFQKDLLLLHREREDHIDQTMQIHSRYLLVGFNHGPQTIEQFIENSYAVLNNDEKNIHRISIHSKLNEAFFNKFMMLSRFIQLSSNIIMDMEKGTWNEKLSNIILRQQILAHKMQMQLQELYLTVQYQQRKFEQDQRVIMTDWTRPFSIALIDRLNPISKAKILISEKIKQRLDQISLEFEFKNKKINDLYSYLDIMVSKRKEQDTLKNEEKTKRLNQLLVLITSLAVFPILIGQMGMSDHMNAWKALLPDFIMGFYPSPVFQVTVTLLLILYFVFVSTNRVIKKAIKNNYLEESDPLKQFMEEAQKFRWELENKKYDGTSVSITLLQTLFERMKENPDNPGILPRFHLGKMEMDDNYINSLFNINEELEAMYELFTIRNEMEKQWKKSGNIQLKTGMHQIHTFVDKVMTEKYIDENFNLNTDGLWDEIRYS